MSLYSDSNCVLFWKYALFGILENSREKHRHVYMINLIILHAKFHIHKCKKKFFFLLGKKWSIILILFDFLLNKRQLKR